MTLSYSFHPVADCQLDDIWWYGYQRWGVKQADKYMDALHDALADIAENIDKATVRDVPINLISPVKVLHY